MRVFRILQRDLLFTLLAVFMALSFSTGQTKISWAGRIIEENGVKVVWNPAKPAYGEIILELEEELSLGGEKTPEDYFGRVFDIEVLPDGTILVIDGKERTLRRIGPDGTYRKNVGRPGQGPGEFSSPRLLAMVPRTEEILVVDFRKIHIFDKEGTFRETVAVPRNILDLYPEQEGDFVARTVNFRGEGQEVQALERITRKGEIKPLAEWSSTLEVKSIPSGGAMVTVVGRAQTGYEQSFLTAAVDERTFVWALSGKYQLTAVDGAGKVLFIARVDEKPAGFTSGEKDKIRESIRSPEARKDLVFPENKAFFDRMFGDDEGRIYTRRKPFPLDDPSIFAYDVFSRNGRFLYHFQVPVQVVVVRTGRLYGIVRDESTGLEYVKRYRIKNWDKLPIDIK